MKPLSKQDKKVLDDFAKEWGFSSWEHWKGKVKDESHSNSDLEQIVISSRLATEKTCLKVIKEQKKDWKKAMKKDKKNLEKLEHGSQGYFAICLLEQRLLEKQRMNEIGEMVLWVDELAGSKLFIKPKQTRSGMSESVLSFGKEFNKRFNSKPKEAKKK